MRSPDKTEPYSITLLLLITDLDYPRQKVWSTRWKGLGVKNLVNTREIELLRLLNK